MTTSRRQQTGHEIIEEALLKASQGDWLNSPMGCSYEEGIAYQQGMAAAYQHALEMILDVTKPSVPKWSNGEATSHTTH